MCGKCGGHAVLIRKALCSSKSCSDYWRLPGALDRARHARAKGPKTNKGKRHATGEWIYFDVE